MVKYTYDAWGKPLEKSGTLATTLGTLSPFRYRGYVYDEETGLYYLRSRYYNPVWNRFVNADILIGDGELLSHNVFAYCLNCATSYTDPSGQAAMGLHLDEGDGKSGRFGKTLAMMMALALASIARIALAPPGAISWQRSEPQEQIRTTTQEITITAEPPRSNNPTYYHATTPLNAALIASSGTLKASSWEAGRVFAWKLLPSKKAIELSGANFTGPVVVISFQTAAAFQPDDGIWNNYVKTFGPVVSVLSGSIYVQNVMPVMAYNME